MLEHILCLPLPISLTPQVLLASSQLAHFFVRLKVFILQMLMEYLLIALELHIFFTQKSFLHLIALTLSIFIFISISISISIFVFIFILIELLVNFDEGYLSVVFQEFQASGKVLPDFQNQLKIYQVHLQVPIY